MITQKTQPLSNFQQIIRKPTVILEGTVIIQLTILIAFQLFYYLILF